MKRLAPDRCRPICYGTFLLLVACAFGLAGCQSLGTRRDPGRTPITARLEALLQLTQADETTQATILAARQADFDATHSADATLAYALALALPGAATHDPATARRLLEGLLDTGSTLDAGDRALATVFLAQLDAELKAQQDQRALLDESQRLRDTQAAGRTATARRLLAEIEENARLRRLLDEARAKLEAVADIAKGRK